MSQTSFIAWPYFELAVVMCLVWAIVGIIAFFQHTTASPVRNYFAIGSNMVPSTMTSLRNLSPQSATAAVLLDYRLAFDIMVGIPWVEPSAASVQYCPGRVVHGVLYELDKDSDFQSLSRSEGVPFTYRWLNCKVIPYHGDGAIAGSTALKEWRNRITQPSPNRNDPSVSAIVLTKSNRAPSWFLSSRKENFIPPSQSYLEILQRGARLWKMDKSYQDELANIQTANGITGVSGIALAVAELWNPRTDIDLLPKDY